MIALRRCCLFVAALAALMWTMPVTTTAAVPFAIRAKDHICIIGNTLAERMQFDGWLETTLHARFPQHELVVRNLAWSGDEVGTRLRELNFGTPDEWLSGTPAPIGGYSENRFAGTNTKADVIFAFFGYNESYAGAAGLDAFKKTLDDWIVHTIAQKYNGTSAPRLVLFSPIAHEDLHNPDLPDGRANNERLALYTRAMGDVAQAHGVRFVDLFTSTQRAYAAARTPLTSNGVHLTAEGNRQLAQIIDRDLFGPPPTRVPNLERLRQAVLDKETYWYHRYRVTDGYATYGERAFLTFVKGNPRDVRPDQVKQPEDILPTNYEVLERELAVLDVMTANRDRRIWNTAKGLDAPNRTLAADDSDTPPFVDAGTNEPGPGPGGAHLFLDGTDAVAKMTTAPGLKVELFASEKEFPELVNPVQMAFDTKGRLWVAAWKSYPHWQPKTPMDDKLLILEDTDGDGKADKRTVFAGDLHNPTGFEFYNGGVIVAQAPNLVFLKDTNGDDHYDVKEILLSGFDTADTHHTLNSFTFDPGGALYMQEGVFMRTQVETPWGPTTREADGAVFRFEPRTSKLEVYVPMNFPNPHGHVFDEWGRDIVNDATNSQPFYGPALSTKYYFPAMAPRDKAPKPGDIRGRPVGGTEILSSRHFPEEMQGNFLALNDITLRGIMSFRLDADGSGLKTTEVEPMLQSSDESFRPVDAEVGPDGALYVADWQNPIIGHMQHNLRDTSRDHTHGRIYRVTAVGRPLLTPTKIAGQPIPQLLDALKETEDRVRYRAKIELSGRDTNAVMTALQSWVAHLDAGDPRYEHHMMEALWLHQWHNRVDEPLLKRMLRSREPLARAAATRVLCYWRDRIPDAMTLLKVQVNDDHPAVRLEAIRALSFFQTTEATAVVLEALNHPQDRYISFALGQAVDTLRPFIQDQPQVRILIDQPPPAVEYQLSRLSNDELAHLERKDGDPKYRLVYAALLTRKGISTPLREEAIAALIKIDRATVTQVLLDGLARTAIDDRGTSDRLATLLMKQPGAQLRGERDVLQRAAEASSSPPALRAAYGALMIADASPDQAWRTAFARPGHMIELLRAIPLLPSDSSLDTLRAQLAMSVAELIGVSTDAAVRAEAFDALATVRPDASTFQLLAREIVTPSAAATAETRAAAVHALLRLPESASAGADVEPLARAVVAAIRQMPPNRRTDAAGQDATQLAERLASLLPGPVATAIRRDARALGVRVVRIDTIPDQMLFTLKWFVVEAGKPVQVVLSNGDTMPHNLVFGKPGALKELGTAAMTMSAPASPSAKAYVPDSPLVLQATNLVNEGESQRLNFVAPAQSGEYVYLCSFPGHWLRMYGVMLVVNSLDEWEASRTTPTDPMTGQPFASQRN